MTLNGFRACAFIGALLAGGCTARPAASVPSSMLLTADAGLTARDEIDGIDAVVDSQGGVYVAWRERLNVYGGSGIRERLVTRYGSGSPLHWGPRIVVAEGGMGTQRERLVATRDGVHLLAGEHLHHWVLPVGGSAKRDLGDALAAGGPLAGPFDAVADNDGLLAIYAVQSQGRTQAIESIRWTIAGAQPPVSVAASSDFRGTTPRLFKDGSRWGALWASNALVEHPDARLGMAVMQAEAGVHAASSLDDGARWSDQGRAVAMPSDVLGFAAGKLEGAPALFVAADGLFESHIAGGAWTQPRRIAAYKAGVFAGSTETSAVAATLCNGRTVVAWVDARNRKSDRHAWNPLGGFPWSDAPDWANNDLFVARDLPVSAEAAAALVPRKLTADGSMTRDVAIVARGGQLLVFRSGRAHVHKAPNDAGAPPEVTQSMVACN